MLVDGQFVLRDGELVPDDGEDVVASARSRAEAAFDRGTDAWRAAGSDLVDRVDDGWL